jgi:N-acetylglutamate synthase-like GNAT family acetyltransferase
MNLSDENIRIISIRKSPEYEERAIRYFQSKWPDVSPIIYEDAIHHSIAATRPLPQWYLMVTDETIIGCAGLITNDFISRGDLYPWVCALYIDSEYRGKALSSLLLEKAREDARIAGFDAIYLSTEHNGLYEKFGFTYVGQGYHPWNAESRIYESKL